MARPPAKRRRRKALDAPEPIEDLIDRAGEDRFAKRRAPVPSREWRAAVGPRIADRAHPVSVEGSVLVVKVATSVWANELSMLGPELVARLSARGFVFSGLRFRVGALDTPDRPPERRALRKVPPPAPLAPELSRSIADVPDDELRAVLTQAASANLAWQAYVGDAMPVSAAPPAARAPRGAGRESAPPDRSAGGSGAASPRTRAGGSNRRR